MVNLGYGSEDEMARPDEWEYKNFALWTMAKGYDQTLPQGIGRFTGAYLNYIGILCANFTIGSHEKLLEGNSTEKESFFIKAVHNPFDLYFGMRIVSLLFSVSTVFVVFLLARELFGNLSGILAACACAISPLLVTEGKSGKEDSFVLFFMLLAAYGLAIWIKNEKLWALRISSFSAGVAFASKIVGVLFVPLMLLKIGVDFLRNSKDVPFSKSLQNWFPSLELLILYFVGGYLFFNLNFLVSPIELLRSYIKIFNVWGPKVEASSSLPFFLFEVLPYGVGWVVVVFAAAAVLYFIAVRNWRVLSLVAVCGMLLALLNKSALVFDRYILFLIPVAAILAFGFIVTLSAGKPRWIRYGFSLGVFLVSLLQIVPTTLATNNLLGKPSTRKLAGDYLRQQMKAGESALILRYPFWLGQGPMYGLNPAKRDWFNHPEWMAKAREHVAFDNVEFLSIDKLGDRKPDWIVVEYHANGQISILPDKMNDAENLLLGNYEELYAVSPAQDFEKVKFNSWALPLSGFQYAQTYGPRVKLFKVNKHISSIRGESLK